jgi:hypothetical protein
MPSRKSHNYESKNNYLISANNALQFLYEESVRNEDMEAAYILWQAIKCCNLLLAYRVSYGNEDEPSKN